MSLLRYIDANKPFDEIKNLIELNPKVLYENDEFLNAVARAAINLDVKLIDYLLNLDFHWDMENTFCYIMSTIAYLYNNVPDHQKDKIYEIFMMFKTYIDFSSDSITRCFEEALYRSNIFLMKLFIECGYLDTREIPNCEPSIYYRLKYFKGLIN
jgi:hypothetical protein